MPELVPVPVAPPVLPTPLQVRDVSRSDVLLVLGLPRTLVPSSRLPSVVAADPVPLALLPAVPELPVVSAPLSREGPWVELCCAVFPLSPEGLLPCAYAVAPPAISSKGSSIEEIFMTSPEWGMLFRPRSPDRFY